MRYHFSQLIRNRETGNAIGLAMREYGDDLAFVPRIGDEWQVDYCYSKIARINRIIYYPSHEILGIVLSDYEPDGDYQEGDFPDYDKNEQLFDEFASGVYHREGWSTCWIAGDSASEECGKEAWLDGFTGFSCVLPRN